MGAPSELVAAQSPIHGNHGAGDVTRARRGEEADEVGNVLGLAVFAHGNVLAALALAEFRRVIAQDLLGDDATGRHAIDGDAVFADFARQTLRPRVHRRLGGDGELYAFGGERDGDGAADADARAGDQRALAGDAEIHFSA